MFNLTLAVFDTSVFGYLAAKNQYTNGSVHWFAKYRIEATARGGKPIIE